MNENNNFNFGVDNNFNMGENGNVAASTEPVTYDSYYNHKPRKKPWGLVIGLIVVALIVLVSLWLSGFFTPMDRQAEYNKLYTRVCSAAVDYADKNNADAKKVSGKIVYVTVGNLIDANLIEAELRNYLTNEPIPATTNIRLEVLPSGTFQCHGFMYPGDDTVKPIITLKGESTIAVQLGTKATDPGATATDDKDGDISDQIKRSGSVVTDTPGTYRITYVVSDRSGNLSNVVTRTYVVQ